MKYLREHFYAILFMVCISVYFILTSGQPFGVRGNLVVDDALFVEHAVSILNGEWLGPFDYRTFCKGPVYPLFIACMHMLGIPLFMAQRILYILACLTLDTSLKNVMSKPWRTVLFIILLFNPVNYSMETTWILREYVALSFAIILIASVIGIFYCKTDAKHIYSWIIICSVMLPLFWLTREDGIWLMPFIGVGMICTWFRFTIYYKKEKFSKNFARVMLLLPFLTLGGGIVLVSCINYTHYGIYKTVDTNSGSLKNAYGALLRIQQDNWIPDTPVPKDVREKAYSVSPAFAKLKPYFEGALGNGLVKNKDEYEDIKGRFFQWALREYASYAGMYKDAQTAEAYFQTVADEINAACDSGLIKSETEEYSSFMQPWDNRYVPLLKDIIIDSANYIINYEAINPNTTMAVGSEESIRIFEQVTNTQAMREPADNISIRGWAYGYDSPVQLQILDAESLETVDARIEWIESPDIYKGTMNIHNEQLEFEYFKSCRYNVSFRGEQYKKYIMRLISRKDYFDINIEEPPAIHNNNNITCAVDMISKNINTYSLTQTQWSKLQILKSIGRIYQKLNGIIFLLSTLLYFVLIIKFCVLSIKKLKCRYGADLLVTTGIALTALLRMCISSAFNLYTAADMRISYFLPVYTLMLLFEIMVINTVVKNINVSASGILSRLLKTSKQEHIEI